MAARISHIGSPLRAPDIPGCRLTLQTPLGSARMGSGGLDPSPNCPLGSHFSSSLSSSSPQGCPYCQDRLTVRFCSKDPGESQQAPSQGSAPTQRQLKDPGGTPSLGDLQSVRCSLITIKHFSIYFQYAGMKGSTCPSLAWGREGLGAHTSQGNSPAGAAGYGVQLVASPHCSSGTGRPDV